MRIAIWIILSALVFLTGCPVPPGPVEVPPGGKAYVGDPATGSGFWLYLPTSYKHEKPMPVIISCHGTPPYDVAEHHIRTWEGYAEKYGCIAVAPDLVGTDGIFGDGPVNGMLQNERSILSILSTLSYKYNIDRANIMITGFSGGGFPAYWVGLRHPDLFSVVVAQNCNFNRSNTDGWYPRSAVKIPVMVYYGENDPGTIVVQSKNAIQYLRSRGFDVDTYVIPGAGHDRHPEIAMKFFRNHWKTPVPTMRTTPPRRTTRTRQAPPPTGRTYRQTYDGPRPP